MGKRKRRNEPGVLKIDLSGDTRKREDRQDDARFQENTIAASTMSSREAFRHEWMNASEERRAELTQVKEGSKDMQIEHRPKRKKHKKKKRKSDLDSKEIGTTALATAPDMSLNETNRVISTVTDNSNDTLLPGALSKHQRRRWRKKLIRQGQMPGSQPAPSNGDARQQSTPDPTTMEHQAVAWADKPMARKTLAKHLAITTLMQPPTRRWEGHDGASTAGAHKKMPWQRSAATCDKVMLPESSMGGETDIESVVSGAADPSCVLKIHESGPKTPGPSSAKESTTSKNSLRMSLLAGLGASAGSKRHSFGSKANSVPTYTVQGDVAERFRRFSAAAHGKAVDDGSDESSDTSSESSSDDAAIPAEDSVQRADAHAPDASNHRGIRAGHDEANDEKTSQIGISSEYRGLRTMADLMSPSRKPQRGATRNERPIFGSDVGGRRSSKLLVAESDKDDYRTSAHGSSQGEAGISSIDDEAFDADQAVQDVFESEMMLTRELPAGKKARIPNAEPEREDGLLTRDSSHRRVTRSASKANPDMLVKRTDSAIPDTGSNVVIVQSMRLPESVDGRARRESRSTGVGDREIERDAVDGTGPVETQASSSVLARHRSSSALSELSQTPSPPQDRSENTESSPDEQRQQLFEAHPGHQIAVTTTEQTSEPKKKRKMTGLTSKHFSTPKTKKTRRKAPGPHTEQEAVSTTSARQDSATDDQSRNEGSCMRTTPTKAVLAETRNLLRDASPSGEHASSQRPKKRTRPSGRKITDLTDANIMESRSRRPHRTTRSADEPEDLTQGIDDAPVENVKVDGQDHIDLDEGMAEPKPKRVKRSRRSSGTLANLSPSNIMERRFRRSTDNVQAEDSHVDNVAGGVQPKDQDEHRIVATPEPEQPEAERKLKKRPRPSGGRITDLDSSNIISSQRRKRRNEKDALVQEQPPNQTEPPVIEPRAKDEAPPKPKAKRKSTGKRSIYFTPTKPPLGPEVDRVDHYNTTGKKGRVPAGVSIAPVPSIHSDRFGIIQEKLWREPFWLLIAVTFLNKTAGRAAAPVFWQLKEKYQTPEALADADPAELLDMIWHLGLQKQRTKRLIAMAKAWVEKQPEASVRWRVLHYPSKGDGKAYSASTPIEEDAADVSGAIEIGHIPGCGPYAMDSWRMFCRDVLRGVAENYNGSNGEVEGFVPEWQKVIPGDKELRACLRWMWLREGWIWEHEGGTKRRATEREMEAAVRGEMEVADLQEGMFAARAAGVEGVQRTVVAEAGAEDEVAGSPTGGSGSKVESEILRGRKRAAPTEMDGGEDDDDASSDNIIVGSPVKRRRTSRRTTT